MIKNITVSAPGKIYLMGEHAVVYGKPGLLTTIDKRCFITLILDQKLGKARIIDKKFDLDEVFSLDTLISQTQIIRKKWQKFDQTKTLKDLKNILSSEIDLVKTAIIENFAFYQKQFQEGFTISIDSQIPTGSGLGSSGALAVCVSAAINALLHVQFNLGKINDIAYIIEQRQHGTPSGADNTISTFGGLLWFRKETEILKSIGVVPVKIPNSFALKFLLIQTGKPQESTGEMVNLVKSFGFQNPNKLKQFLDSQEQITRDLLTVLKTANESEFIYLIKKGESNLEKINIVSPRTQKLVRQIEKTNSAAKICGAGGLAENSGIILAFGEINKIKKIALDFNYTFFQTKLGVEGVKIETNKN